MYKSLWLSALQPRRRLDLSVVPYRNFEPGSREEQGQWPGSLMKHFMNGSIKKTRLMLSMHF